MKFDPDLLKLYLIADRCQVHLLDKTKWALQGGVTLVQLRMKEAEGKAFYEMAVEIKKLCSRYQVPLIINDRIDIALAVNADGVHIGQTDLPLSVARSLLGKEKILGITARTLEEIKRAELDGADYCGIGALGQTKTKDDCEVMSLDDFQKLCEKSTLPVVGIGGITAKIAPAIIASGASGVAVSSEILSSINPQIAASQF